MNEHNKSLLYIHAAVFLFGFSALFARLVNQPAIVITFGRVFFSSIFLFLLIKLYKITIKLNSKKDYFLIILSGIVLAIHWFCFILSIQLSTVAIGTITFSTFPVFTSLLEPLFFKERIKVRTVICSLFMLGGILIIVLTRNRELAGTVPGIIVGLISSLSYSVLALLNRNFSSKYKSETIVFYEQLTATVFLLPIVFMIKPEIRSEDIIFLAILGVIFTAIAHGLFVKGLRFVKAGTAGVISGLEVVYSILLASVFLMEIPRLNEIIGGLIIILLAGYMTVYKEKTKALPD